MVRLQIDELEVIWKDVVVAYSRYSPGSCLEELREKTKNLSQDSRCPARDSNLTPPEYRYAAPLGITYVKCVSGNEQCQCLYKELTTDRAMVSYCEGQSSSHVWFLADEAVPEQCLRFCPTNHHFTIAIYLSLTALWGERWPWPISTLSHPRSK